MWKKIVGGVLFAAVALPAAGFTYFYFRKPASAPPVSVKIVPTRQRLARGKYLFEAVADCSGCHSQGEFTAMGLRTVAGGRGRGQVLLVKDLPGTVVAPNITPDVETGIGSWTDGEKIRAIREGVDREGRALFPMMPYKGYRNMTDEDVQSLVVYLDSLPPVRNPLPKTKLDFPVNLLIKGAPEPVGMVPEVDRSNPDQYGEYLVTMGGCAECHTPAERGKLDESLRLAGGRVFALPMGTVVSANITPHGETGIGKLSRAQFIERFSVFRGTADHLPLMTKPEQLTLMPWLTLSNMTDEDLGMIYHYLQKQPAIEHAVIRHPAAK